MMNKEQLINALAAQRIGDKPYEFRVTEYICAFAKDGDIVGVLQQSLQALQPNLAISDGDIFIGYTSDSGEELRIRLSGNAREIYSREFDANSRNADDNRTQIMEPLALAENAHPTRIIPAISDEPAIHEPAPRDIAPSPEQAEEDPSGQEATRRIVPISGHPDGKIVQVGENTRVVMPIKGRGGNSN